MRSTDGPPRDARRCSCSRCRSPSLAILIPRLAFIGTSSLHRGYDALGQPVRSAANIQDRPLATNGVWAAWPLAFGSAPGAYAGAVDAARRPVRVARSRAPCTRLGVRRVPGPDVAPHAERDRHSRVVPDAPAEGAVRRRVPPQPRTDALPLDDRDPGARRGGTAGSRRPADERHARPVDSGGRRRAPRRVAARPRRRSPTGSSCSPSRCSPPFLCSSGWRRRANAGR